jgi:hypothetical protein
MFTLESFVRNTRSPEDGVSQFITNDMIGDVGHFDPGLMRPYKDGKGNVWVDVTKGHEIVKDQDGAVVYNTQGAPKMRAVYEPELVSERRRKDLPVINVTGNATVLRKDQWIMIDQTVIAASRKRMTAWADLRASNSFGVDGMAVPILEWERLTDAGQAVVDMDGISENARNFAPHFELQGLPLPITHSDFWLSQRFLAASRRNGGPGSDTVRAEMAGRRVGETIEQTLIGTQTGTLYGDNNSYVDTTPQVTGYTNHADRITVTGATAPTGSNGTTILTEWLDHRDEMYQRNFYGPFNLYTATNYDQFLDDEFKANSDRGLRERLLAIEGISSIKRLDYLTTAGTYLWIQMGEEIQAVNGMEVTTVQWESKGGLQLNFKVMAIQVPRIRAVNINDSTTGVASVSATDACPILHVTV